MKKSCNCTSNYLKFIFLIIWLSFGFWFVNYNSENINVNNVTRITNNTLLSVISNYNIPSQSEITSLCKSLGFQNGYTSSSICDKGIQCYRNFDTITDNRCFK